VFRAQADWTFILPSELTTKELGHLPRKMLPQAYQTSQYVVRRGGIFLDKWRSSFIGSSDGKMNVQSSCVLNTLYMFSITKTNRLILFKEIIVVNCENHTKSVNALHAENSEFFS
jgi:hypothetical protein